MSNKYGISEKELIKIRERDKTCVYCHKVMIDPRSRGRRIDWATIEHLNFMPPWNNASTVAICCWSCNSSRGSKKLLDWFKGEYCLIKKINEKTVAKPVREFIKVQVKSVLTILSN
ncbi:MAG: hypothetical protein G01um10145_539 [Microgenomates group bacterium Gr01-1014_5]|nr:MAG: hypothetical protein G01um10145_539 [Microgenomates group bacterium Gr01-1014_5]